MAIEYNYYTESGEVPDQPTLEIFENILTKGANWGVASKVTGIMSDSGGLRSYYQTFDIPKGAGRVRTINAPISAEKDPIKATLRLIQGELSGLLGKAYLPDEVTGFRRGRSIYVGLAEMLQKLKKKNEGQGNIQAMFSTDIVDFFPSVTQEQVFTVVLEMFTRMFGTKVKERKGNSKKWPKLYRDQDQIRRLAALVTHLCCYEGHLPQGAPTSPALSNMVGTKFDRAILNNIDHREQEYLRYADNIVVASIAPIAEETRDKVGHILRSQGFQISHRKTTYEENKKFYELLGVHVLPANEKQEVGMRFKVPKRLEEDLEKELYAIMNSSDSEIKEENLLENKRVQQILGRLAHVFNVSKHGGTPRDVEPGEPILPRDLTFAWKNFQKKFGSQLPKSQLGWFTDCDVEMRNEKKVNLTFDVDKLVLAKRVEEMCQKRQFDAGQMQNLIKKRKIYLKKIEKKCFKNKELFDSYLQKEYYSAKIKVYQGLVSEREEGAANEEQRQELINEIIATTIAVAELMLEKNIHDPFSTDDEGQALPMEMASKFDSGSGEKNRFMGSILPPEIEYSWNGNEEFRNILVTHDPQWSVGLKYLFADTERKEEIVQKKIVKKKLKDKQSRTEFISFPKYENQK